MSSSRKTHPFYALSSIRLLRRPPRTKPAPRLIPAPVLLYVTRGGGRLVIDDHVWTIEPEQLVLIPAGVHLRAVIGGKGVEYYQVVVRSALLSFSAAGCTSLPLTTLPGMSSAEPLIVRGSKSWRSRLSRLLARYGQADVYAHELDSHLQLLLNDLKLQAGEKLAGEERREGQEGSIQRTIDYMEQHFTHKISRDTLAHIANLSPGAYCRSFKRTTGMTPTEYLNRIRIQKAQQQLAQGAGLREAAAAVSYNNEFHFSRVFKKVTGIPPTVYMKRELLRVAVATRFNWRDNLQTMGCSPLLSVDCYRHPGMDASEYERRFTLRLAELRQAKPDLIIGDFSHEPFYDTFKKIAPTVMLDHCFDWRVTHRQLAELIGREQEAERTIAQSDRAAAEAGLRLNAVSEGSTVAVMQIMPDHIMLQGMLHHPLNDLLYRELGLLPEPAVPRNHMRLQLTAQDMPELRADHVWIRKYSEHADIEHVLNQLQARDFWSAMPAFQSGRIRFIANWLLLSWTPQGRLSIIQDVERYLSAAARQPTHSSD